MIMAENRNPKPVVGPEFCSESEVELVIVKALNSVVDGNWEINDANGRLVYRVNETLMSRRDRHVLMDNTNNPLVTILKKTISLHDRWEAYRGDSADPQDLIFFAKKSSLIQIKTNLDVFLANNTEQKVYDYKVKGSLLKRSCVIYAGDNIIAQMKKKTTIEGLVIGKKSFNITVHPNVDSAFVVALILMLHLINADD